jgi:hypothetical protein
VYQAENLVATHLLRSYRDGWSTIPEHHAELWQETLQVEQHSLAAYEEIS